MTTFSIEEFSPVYEPDEQPALQHITPELLTFLAQHELQQAFHRWNAEQPVRSGLHVASLLASPEEWCARQHVYANVMPEAKAQTPLHWSVLSKFVHGWSIHEKWQHKLLKRSGLVARHPESGELELDLTHYDEIRDLYFSPDLILQIGRLPVVVEIKGINHDEYAGHPAYYDDAGNLVKAEKLGVAGATLEQAMQRNKSVRSAVPQLNLYLHLLQLPVGLILVEDKNNQDFTLFAWKYDREMAQPLAFWASQVKAYTQAYRLHNRLPKRTCSSANDTRARNCPFRSVCFKDI